MGIVTPNRAVGPCNYDGTCHEVYEYFGGKLLKNAQGWVNQDRLGSVGKFFPYGQERPSATTNGTEKFATYVRDAETGLDYAQNRYHSAGFGRFLTPDPYQASGGPGDPGSWNRYAYVGGDPVNGYDPAGLQVVDPSVGGSITVTAAPGSQALAVALGGGRVGGIPYLQVDLWCPGDDGGAGNDCDEFFQRRTFIAPPPVPYRYVKATLGAMAEKLQPAIELAHGLLEDENSECSKIFSGPDGVSPYSMLVAMIQGSEGLGIKHLVFDELPEWAPGKTVLSEGLIQVTLNDSLTAFGSFAANNTAAGAATLLHELGHVYNFLGLSSLIVDDDTAEGQAANARTISTRCGL